MAAARHSEPGEGPYEDLATASGEARSAQMAKRLGVEGTDAFAGRAQAEWDAQDLVARRRGALRP
jgi:hypothetical protein